MKNASIRPIPPAQTNILLALAEYKFLTNGQMQQLGIMKGRDNLNKQILALKKDPTSSIAQISFGVHPELGKLENFYYMTSFGKAYLVEAGLLEDGEIKLPIGTATLFTQDYFHRKSTIDFHILVNQWCNLHERKLVFFNRYFDTKGSNRTKEKLTSLTKIFLEDDRFFIPDGVFQLDTGRQMELYLLEVYNGSDTGRVIKQMQLHLEALHIGAPTEQFNFDRGHRILCVFESLACMNAVMERLSNDSDFRDSANHFLFKPIASLEAKTLHEDWQCIDGDKMFWF
ncbi:MAG: hypothetical protein JWQ09_3148 [Segetibacter sp.]|nr:hypothetical protein [Segetibacter sp.]